MAMNSLKASWCCYVKQYLWLTRLFPFIFFCCYDLIFTLFIFSEKEKHQLINHLRVIPLCLWEKLLFYKFFFTVFSIWFSVFVKNTYGFFGFGIRCGFRFFLFGFRFLFDLSGNFSLPRVSHSRETHFASLVTSVSDLKGFWQPECENLSVLRAVFGVDRYFFGFFCFVFFFLLFAVLRFWNIFFYGFAISNRPQCPPHRGN